MDIISSVYNRQMALTETETNISYTAEQVIAKIKDPNLQHEAAVKEYFRQVSHYPIAEENYVKTLNVLKALKESGETGLFQTMSNHFITQTVPHIKDTQKIVEYFTIVPELEVALKEAAGVYETIDRIINNNNKIEKRFDLDGVLKECKFADTEAVSESLCALIDTYDAPIHKKLNISLEEAFYLYEKSGAKFDKSALVQNVLEYFLRENCVLSDIDYSKIKNVLENNVLITEADKANVKYIFQHESSYSHKLSVLSESVSNENVKSLLREMSQCKTLNVAKAIIKKTCNIITALFVVGAVITFAEAMTLLVGLFAMILIVATAPGALITAIKDSLKTPEQLDAEQKAREKQVREALNSLSKEINKVDQKAAQREAAIAFDTIYKDDDEYFDPSMLKIDQDDDHMFSFDKINFAVVTESEDFADSDDVKKIIDKYKAEQNKTEGKLKRVLEHIYTKKPQQVIDETPHILSFLRKFAILSIATIPHIGVAVALVTWCVDKFIEMTLQRKEAEKVLAYFEKEKEKVERDINKAKSDAKIERLESYLACLEKSIDKLETYRDDLYSEKELDRIKGYDEAVVIDFANKLSVADYFERYHATVACNLDIAIREMKRKLITNPVGEFCVEEYDINGVEIGSFFRALTEKDLHKFINPDGIISVPVFKIKYAGEIEVTGHIIDTWNEVSKLLESNCMLDEFCINGYTYIIFNFMHALAIDYMPEIRDHATTEEVRESMAYLEMVCEAAEIMEDCEPEIIVRDMAKSVDRLVTEDLNCISNILINSGLQPDDFVDSLKDYKDTCDDYNTCHAISNAISKLEKECSDDDYTEFECMEATMIQMESFVALREILEASKDKEKKGKVVEDLKKRAEKGIKPIRKKAKEVGEKVKDGAKDAKERAGKLSTNLKLGMQGAKRDAIKLSTKEKELSKGIDASVATLKKGIENSLKSDRREGIIKGSVIPSFSKCIKLGIATGAAYLVSPTLAAIGAIGGLAASVSLNRKERKALLDEIEIELKVVEKELDLAEKEDNMKKYKQLLKYQKALRRESQRIRYKLKIKGQELPDPEA